MTKLKYEIVVSGCDDSTRIEEELSKKEYELVDRIANKINETSSYGCMPTMRVELIGEKKDER